MKPNKYEGWLPKSVLCLRDYSVCTFVSDLIAGFTVGLVALPLAMAFAISSGVPPQSGIYCAVVAGVIISALGSSRCQIGGQSHDGKVDLRGANCLQFVPQLERKVRLTASPQEPFQTQQCKNARKDPT